jgi:hypothetical protein
MPETNEQEIGFDRYFPSAAWAIFGLISSLLFEARKCSILGMGLFRKTDFQPPSHGFTLYFDTTFRGTMGLQD